MHIALDARTLYAPQRRGIGKSLLQLYRHLAVVRPDWRVTAYHRHRPIEPNLLPADFAQPRWIDMPGDRFDAWHRLRLPLAAKRARADVLHCPANHCPRWMPIPTVVSVHDLIPLDMPDSVPPREVQRFEQSLRLAVMQAAAITCPSQYTAQRLVHEHGARQETVCVTPWGAEASADETMPPLPERLPEMLRRYGIDRRFVLHFGAGDPRKNTQRLIEAWAVLPQALRQYWQLVIVGLDDEALGRLQRCCELLGVGDRVMLHGFAPQHEMRILLRLAKVLAYPSLSEGFGLPILEAFAADTPVLTSNRTSLPEIAGDAAYMVDPEDWRSIHVGLTRILKERSLRQQLIERGRVRLEAFSWTHCAEQFAQAVEAAAQSRPAALPTGCPPVPAGTFAPAEPATSSIHSEAA